MTVEWITYAQSLTRWPMNRMLTGPVTILQWSFVRDDQPRSLTAWQIALAIRDEAIDLEQAGIAVNTDRRAGFPRRLAAQAEGLGCFSGLGSARLSSVLQRCARRDPVAYSHVLSGVQ